MQVNMNETEDDNMSDILSPKGVETPKPMNTPGYTVPGHNEDDRVHMEERLHRFLTRLVDQPDEIVEMLSHAQYTMWDSFVMMDVDEIPELTFPCWRGPVCIST